MKLVRYAADDGPRLGIAHKRGIQPLGNRDLRELMPPGAKPSRACSVVPVDELTMLPPLMPGKILAIGRNYAEHARELDNEVPPEPLVFAVMPSAVIGDGAVIEWEGSLTAQVDWEGELAVIIGRTARRVQRELKRWIMSLAIRSPTMSRLVTLQSRDQQWTRAKGLDTFCPLGPAVVTRDEILDPQNLRIVTKVNGVTMQDGSTADMIFKVRYLIAHLSRAFTLDPGDVILTGTPSGVGKAQNPPQFLVEGSVVSVEIEGIGKLTNRCRVL